MNPFKVNKVIRENNMNDKQICVDTLSELCGGRVKHAFLRMSDETFLCAESGGFPRHWVKASQLVYALVLSSGKIKCKAKIGDA